MADDHDEHDGDFNDPDFDLRAADREAETAFELGFLRMDWNDRARYFDGFGDAEDAW
jgi:hypothetical protein